MTGISVGDEVTWNGHGTPMEGTVLALDQETGKATLAHGDHSQWQAQLKGDDLFAFSGTKDGESIFDYPVRKVSEVMSSHK